MIPDPPKQASQEVVPVGEDEGSDPDASVDQYRQALDDLEQDVHQTRNGHHVESSPPRSALH